jgi:pyruvate,water dikinase
MSRTATPLIQWFRDIGIHDVAGVGGKGASLGELTRAGIRVPVGFVVTTAAFHQFLMGIGEQDNIRAAIESLASENLSAIQNTGAAIRGRIERSALPGVISRAIADAYRRLSDGADNAPVAIRSSATSEDSAEASFAGLQDTYLWVRGEADVMERVRSCWISLYSDESISYRRRLKLPELGLGMGVVVQRMVDSLCSGVMFTRSPTTGDKSVVTLEGSWGLGSCIVSGEVTPDKFVINKVTGEIMDRSVAVKLIQHVPALKGGVITEPVPAEKQRIPCLFDEQIAELVEIAKRVERHYGCPQDIEWAIAKDTPPAAGPYLLQSRPETVWSAKAAHPIAGPKPRSYDHVFSVLSRRGK